MQIEDRPIEKIIPYANNPRINKHTVAKVAASYDPFVGSGTTIIAAETISKTCYAIDIDPHYVDVCVKRWENFTGLKATHHAGAQ